MSMTRKIAQSAALVLLTGCASVATTNYDNFTGKTTYSSASKSISTGNFLSADIQFQQVRDAEQNVSYDIIVTTQKPVTTAWENTPLKIKSGESLLMIVDGKRMAFSSERGGQGARLQPGLLSGIQTEHASYENVSSEDLLAIASADEVQVKVIGEERSIEGTVNISLKANLIEFVNHALDAGLVEPEVPTARDLKAKDRYATPSARDRKAQGKA